MFDWLYSIFVSIVSFVLSLVGLSLDKRSVELMGNQKEEPVVQEVVDQAVVESAQLP